MKVVLLVRSTPGLTGSTWMVSFQRTKLFVISSTTSGEVSLILQH